MAAVTDTRLARAEIRRIVQKLLALGCEEIEVAALLGEEILRIRSAEPDQSPALQEILAGTWE